MSDASRVLAGRYRLARPLGRGGMGEVWEAHDEVLNRPVAVKMLHLATAQDPYAAARFRREAQTVASLSHANIVTVYDTGTEDDTAYLVMELLSGPSLADMLRDHGPLPVHEAVHYAEQAASALAAAHAAGVVHRDVKPANLMLASDGSLRVLDFGIARLLEQSGQTQLTATQSVVGTADYLSPEQARGGQVDARADLYALGCVLVALLSGRPPFKADSAVALLGQHLYAEPPRLADLRQDAPAWLDSLVGDLLAKDPDARPASADEVVDRIRARGPVGPVGGSAVPPRGSSATAVMPAAGGAGAGTPTAAYAADGTTGGPPARDGRRGRRLLLLLGVLVLAAAALLAFALMNDGGESPQGSQQDHPGGHASSASPDRTTPSPTPTTPSPTPTQTPTETTTPAPEEPTTTEAIAQVRDAIAREQADGELEQKDADRLRDKVNEVEKKTSEGDTDRAAEETDHLGEELDKLEQSGKISPAAAARIRDDVDTLAGTF